MNIIHGDCLEELKKLEDNSIDAVVCDPPYGLSNTKPQQVADVLKAWVTGDTVSVPAKRGGFMGKDWDSFVPPPAVWEECMRVLKPGGHMAVFAGARTQDLMGLSIRLAGFEIRDTLGWIYGSGFPKSMDVSKAIDKGQGKNRQRQLEFTEWMRSTGITATQINEATETNMGNHYLTAASQPAIATADLFDKLRPLLPEVPERIERLVAERTGIEWTDYVKREITQHATRELVQGDAISFDQRSSKERERRDIPATSEAQRWDGWGTAPKPAIEPILLAQKPFNVVPLYEVANKTHHILGALKWLSLSPAKRAEITSTSNHQEPHAEMCASALANAETEQSPEKYAATDTFRSPEMALTYLNTEKLWQSILGAISDPTTTFTTSTESSTITVLKTLNSLLAPITSATTMPPCECLLNGQPSNVINAESNSSENWSNWKATLNVSVPESVIEQTAKTALSLLANIAENLSQPGTAAGGGSVLSHAQIELITQSGESRNEHANGAGSLTSLAGKRGGSVQSAAQQNTSAIDPIILARKPLDGTVANNVLAHGVGGLNIDACRVGTSDTLSIGSGKVGYESGLTGSNPGAQNPAGRFPANVLLDEHAAKEMDKQSGVLKDRGNKSESKSTYSGEGATAFPTGADFPFSHDTGGGASRFFPVFKYQAKAPKKERPVIEREDGSKIQHATVKPLALMEWLVSLIVPPGGVVLDPFAGSGTTLQAALNKGFTPIGIEQDADYIKLIEKRLEATCTTHKN